MGQQVVPGLGRVLPAPPLLSNLFELKEVISSFREEFVLDLFTQFKLRVDRALFQISAGDSMFACNYYFY